MILQSYKKFFKCARNILQKLAETCKNLQGQIKMLYLCSVERMDKRKVERGKRKEITKAPEIEFRITNPEVQILTWDSKQIN